MSENDRQKGRIQFILAILTSLIILPLLLVELYANAQPTVVAVAPQFTPPSGQYTHPIVVTLDGAPNDSEIFYTLDGRNPQLAGQKYTQPLALRETGVTVIWTSYREADQSWSQLATATYVVGLDTHLPLLSLISEPDGLYSADRGLFAHPQGRGHEWERLTQVMFFEGDRNVGAGKLAFTSAAGLRVHGSASRQYPKLSLRLYFRSEYGNPRLNYPLYAGQEAIDLQSFDRLILHGGSQDYATPYPDPRSNWTLLRSQLLYELAAELDLYTTQARPILLFINGQSRGIYSLRTMPDETYLFDRYGITAVNMFAISGLPSSPNELYVSEFRAQWDKLLDFIALNDINDPAIYAEIERQIDIDTLIDYTIIQMYAGNTDWLRNNVRLFKIAETDQWSWLIWDVDQAFGLAPWSDVTVNMPEWLYLTERPGFERGALLWRKLLVSEPFRQRYLTRLDQLLGTVLSAEKVATQLDSMAAEMRPDIHFETNYWTSPGDWEASIAEMRDFITRRPDIMRENHAVWFKTVPWEQGK